MKQTIQAMIVAAMAFAAASALAQAPAPNLTEAEVRKVDREAQKLTLKHGAIKNLDMPPMTMVFQVRDPALLEKLRAGDRVRFSAEEVRGAYIVTGIERLP